MQVFIDNDEGYLAWLASNPDGWVINSHRKPSPSYLRLHRSPRPLTGGVPANGRSWTNGYRKTCGTEAELRAWALGEVGGVAVPCSRCA